MLVSLSNARPRGRFRWPAVGPDSLFSHDEDVRRSLEAEANPRPAQGRHRDHHAAAQHDALADFSG
jgi:hypothetical protein